MLQLCLFASMLKYCTISCIVAAKPVIPLLGVLLHVLSMYDRHLHQDNKAKMNYNQEDLRALGDADVIKYTGGLASKDKMENRATVLVFVDNVTDNTAIEFRQRH